MFRQPHLVLKALWPERRDDFTPPYRRQPPGTYKIPARIIEPRSLIAGEGRGGMAKPVRSAAAIAEGKARRVEAYNQMIYGHKDNTKVP